MIARQHQQAARSCQRALEGLGVCPGSCRYRVAGVPISAFAACPMAATAWLSATPWREIEGKRDGGELARGD